ncbi:MarR family winged helix-turn-helix transcriptional regulator [Sphingomonas sp. 22176]|uniref:MarR family winged helix-turn-helix transcriptional regulator n=1 Tax=Sphingomonas sp. 22176 TaxID=3453884 RepID=UPI003F82F8C8
MTDEKSTPQGDRERVIQVRDLIVEVFGASGNLIETGNRLTHPLGITSALWQVMGALGFACEPLSVPMIAKRMGLTRQSVQRNVDLLIERGLVSLEANPRHRRSALACLTEAGRATLDQIDARHQPLSLGIADAIGDARIADALRVLREMNAILDMAATEADDQGACA